MWNEFVATIFGVFEQYFPFYHVSFMKNERLEWVTGEIKESLG